ncbi:hypothetical protein K440DRAFT_635927 [Wilcoxina mikolae CBS 423.85]|nr:hypothetical protein K440DRAFT_635927 [Wilcoxina mikolae CBS 423.85]
MVIGGFLSELNTTCQEFLQIMDMSTLKMVREFSDEVPYEVPSIVTKVIGGSAKGGATSTKPSGGFLPDIENILSQPYEFANRSGTQISDNAPKNTDPRQSNDSKDSDRRTKKLPLGAIRGGVVAGIICFYFIAVVARIRWKKHQLPPATHAELEGRSQLA